MTLMPNLSITLQWRPKVPRIMSWSWAISVVRTNQFLQIRLTIFILTSFFVVAEDVVIKRLLRLEL
jgi:hypothetical protein